MEKKQRSNGEALATCEVVQTHGETLARLARALPPEEQIRELAELFKVFGDLTRMRILFVLFEAEACVCDLSAALGMTSSAVSHQLRLLKQSRLVRSRREGKSVFYSLADEHVRTVIAAGMEHVTE